MIASTCYSGRAKSNSSAPEKTGARKWLSAFLKALNECLMGLYQYKD
jgi:hypothetical protein